MMSLGQTLNALPCSAVHWRVSAPSSTCSSSEPLTTSGPAAKASATSWASRSAAFLASFSAAAFSFLAFLLRSAELAPASLLLSLSLSLSSSLVFLLLALRLPAFSFLPFFCLPPCLSFLAFAH